VISQTLTTNNYKLTLTVVKSCSEIKDWTSDCIHWFQYYAMTMCWLCIVS